MMGSIGYLKKLDDLLWLDAGGCEIMENVAISARKVLHGYDGPTVDAANAVSSHVEGLRLSLSDFDKVEKSK